MGSPTGSAPPERPDTNRAGAASASADPYCAARIDGAPYVTPLLRWGEMTVVGSLAPEAVRRVLSVNYGAFRLCYERGRNHNPCLVGSVTARFVIGSDGRVPQAESIQHDLPDGAAVECIVDALRALEFPEPTSGTVTVLAPITFTLPPPTLRPHQSRGPHGHLAR